MQQHTKGGCSALACRREGAAHIMVPPPCRPSCINALWQLYAPNLCKAIAKVWISTAVAS
jgi:hypothetical protein